MYRASSGGTGLVYNVRDILITEIAKGTEDRIRRALSQAAQTGVFHGITQLFQQSEVDKIPTVLSRPNPIIPSWVRQGAESLRVVMLLLVDQNGAVKSVRVLESSGNPEFDAIITRDALEAWVFTPAIKKGKRVRCLVQQYTRVNWTGSRSPFEP